MEKRPIVTELEVAQKGCQEMARVGAGSQDLIGSGAGGTECYFF